MLLQGNNKRKAIDKPRYFKACKGTRYDSRNCSTMQNEGVEKSSKRHKK